MGTETLAPSVFGSHDECTWTFASVTILEDGQYRKEWAGYPQNLISTAADKGEIPCDGGEGPGFMSFNGRLRYFWRCYDSQLLRVCLTWQIRFKALFLTMLWWRAQHRGGTLLAKTCRLHS